MKKLILELDERLEHLHSQDKSAENTFRINEVLRILVRAQQIFLEELKMPETTQTSPI